MNVGRVSEAASLARNMIELPRHPKYNTLSKGGSSAKYGRRRLFEVLYRFELWDQLVGLDIRKQIREVAESRRGALVPLGEPGEQQA